MKLGDYYLDDYALDDEYDNQQQPSLIDSFEEDAEESYNSNIFDNFDKDVGSAYYENELVEDLDLGDDEDIIYEVDNLLSNYKQILSRPVFFDDTVDANEIGNEREGGKGVWFMISLGVMISVVTVLFVLYLAFKQRYQRLRDDMDEKRQATIANQRARMAQMKQQMEAGNLIDAEALMFDSSGGEKISGESSPFFGDNNGRRDDFTM
jgi:hypothetical protein